MSEDTISAYRCPKCTDHTLVVRPCWKCKIPMEQVSIPSKGRWLIESVDRWNSRLVEMAQMTSFLAEMINEESDE